MSDAVRQYLLSVVAMAMLAGVLLALVPKGAVHRSLSFLSGLAMILVALGPLARVDVDALAQAMSRAKMQAEEAAWGVTIDNTEWVADIIKRDAEAYIWDRAEELDIRPEAVEVTVAVGGTYPYPYSADITATAAPTQQNQLERALEAELAIPAERQEWHEP